MFDITLYGHLTNDTIIDNESETMSLGGIANCWRTLIDLDSKLQIGLMPTAIGTSEIIINRTNSTRTSKSNLNETTFTPDIKLSKIHHVMYLNELPDTTFIPKLDGILSADLCLGKEVDYELLKYFDYIFVSNDEHDVNKIKKYSKGAVIAHDSDGSIYWPNVNDFAKSYTIDKKYLVDNANVLGAGDMFASCFLYAILSNRLNIAVEYAHITTSSLIRKYNEKI